MKIILNFPQQKNIIKKVLFIPFLDHSITHLKSKFIQHNALMSSFQNLIPSNVFYKQNRCNLYYRIL